MSKNTFKSKKDRTATLVIWGEILFLTSVGILAIIGKCIIVLPVVAIVTMLSLWAWFGTNYIIEETHIKYLCGPFRGRILINAIIKIKKHDSSYAGIRPALSGDGLGISYSRFDKIWISPEREEEFISILQKINPKIEVYE